MATKQLETTTIRLDREGIAEVRRHGGGKTGRVVRDAIRRHFGMMRRELPALDQATCAALAMALDGWPTWAAPDAPRAQRLGPMMADAVAEYPEEYPAHAAEAGVDWLALAETCRGLSDVQVMALCHAAEGWSMDTAGGDAAARLRRHFRVA